MFLNLRPFYILCLSALCLSLLCLSVLCLPFHAALSQTDNQTETLHERLLVLDSHLDTPAVLARPGFDITRSHDALSDYAQVDLPRMNKGGLDGGFWVIYTPQGPLTAEGYAAAYHHAVARADIIDAMLADHPQDFAEARSVAEIMAAGQAGKKIVLKSIENAYPLGTNINRLDMFYDRGVRMLGIVHFKNNQFADSSTDPDGPRWHGLSPAGRALVERANRLGMIIDASHASDTVLAQLIELSKTPVVLSHSGAKKLYDHPRNVPDHLLVKLAESGGVIQINSFPAYLKKPAEDAERADKLTALFAEQRENPAQTVAAVQAFIAKRRALDHAHPKDHADFELVMDHLLHVLDLIGPDHVGIGLDWDGGGGVNGLHDVAGLQKITDRLLQAGYSVEDIEKIWSGNLLRLLATATRN